MDIQEELCCSICQSLFRCPVTIQCGHSFCSDCLRVYWGPQSSCSCPICRHHFPTAPTLTKNVTLSRICELLARGKDGGSAPSHCPSHGSGLEFFCWQEGVLVCSQCAREGHQGHRITQLEQATQEAQESMWREQRWLEKRLAVVEEAVAAQAQKKDSLRASVRMTRMEVERALDEVMGVTLGMQGFLDQTSRRLEQETAKEKSRLECIADHLRERLQDVRSLFTQDRVKLVQGWQKLGTFPDYQLPPDNQIDVSAALRDLPRVITDLAEQMQERLQILSQHISIPSEGASPEKSSPADHHRIQTPGADDQPAPQPLHTSESTPTGTFQPDSSVDTTTHVDKWAMDTPVDRGGAAIFPMSMSESTVEPQPFTKPETIEQLLQYATKLTFDLSTASVQLRIAENGRAATNSWPEKQPYCDGPDRFQRLPQVLARPELGGRHYWELSFSGGTVMVGLAHNSLDRRSRGQACMLGRNANSWCLELSSGTATPWHQGQPGPTIQASCSHLGLFLDLPQQSLAFYGLAHGLVLLHRCFGPFPSTLLPAFYISKGATIHIRLPG
ncbi:E3 ubiquitin-protein ligase TRIM65-like isoform X2 [Narcine bancroftii]|uniref:E3 ubiquitin-protein ligase TRIM65-like isoform X2 n=1 Tax=Narcine bancroftii TaxID=1343680 RepID=UPI00383227C2